MVTFSCCQECHSSCRRPRVAQGYKRITDDLKDLGYAVNHKRVYRLMKELGLQAIYPKKNLSKRRHGDAVFPYLLKDYFPEKPHDCWCTDLTYIKTAKGFIYLTALIDVVSRCVMGWYVSPFLDTEACLNALEMALNTGYKPQIFNSDQGCQYTSQDWVYSLSLLGIKISMDGKGRALDNIPIERFWRTIKYEEVYLKTYENINEARQAIDQYIHWYNHDRRHSGLNKKRPYEVMTGQEKALKWPFSKVDGYGDNCKQLPHISTTTTSTKKQQMDKYLMKLSSPNAA
jgi:putative transposase